MRELLIGSGNPKKRREIEDLVRDLGVTVLTPGDLDPRPAEPVEDGATFAENAEKKAVGYAQASGRWTLADDSGLLVDALGGRPGVHSARYAGEAATDADNVALLLRELEGHGAELRGAAFACALCLAAPDGRVLWTGEGRVTGRILEEARGSGGFGYDPVFVADGETRAFAEMTAEEKRALSHRGRALAAFARDLPALLDSEG